MKSLKKEGHARVIVDENGKVKAEEVVCLGFCKGTFFRKGKDIGNFSVRKCKGCRSNTKKKSGWYGNWGEPLKIPT